MKTKKDLLKIEDFLRLKSFALVGASAKKKKFGNYILRAMIDKGYVVYPVHPLADRVSGVKCYKSFGELPEVPGGVIVVIPCSQTEKVVRLAAEAGIKNFWLQNGANSVEAENFCRASGLTCISGECLLMFLNKPGFPHNIHRWVWNLGVH